jgi:hypothetical protein
MYIIFSEMIIIWYQNKESESLNDLVYCNYSSDKILGQLREFLLDFKSLLRKLKNLSHGASFARQVKYLIAIYPNSFRPFALFLKFSQNYYLSSYEFLNKSYSYVPFHKSTARAFAFILIS